MAKRTKRTPVGLTVFISFVSIIVGLALGLVAPLYIAQSYFTKNLTTDELNETSDVYYSKTEEHQHYADIDVSDADIAVHFIELGNKYTGDCTLIKVGDVEILIDCGSRADSVKAVSAF